jgi:homoprotocatechuate degradation regulator HpaR
MSRTTPFIHRNLPRLLLQAREAVMAHNRPSLRDQGLSDQQWRVLRVLGEDHGNGGNGVETGRIAREAFIIGPSLSGVLTRMERDGLIQRARAASDQRRTVVQATALGLARVATLSTTIEAHYQWMEQRMGKAKLQALYELLDGVIALEAPADSTATSDDSFTDTSTE